MILNLLVVPLAAAYFILTRSYRFKFKVQRLDRNSLFYETVIGAVFILLLGFLLKTFIYDQFFSQHFINSINSLNPLRDFQHSGMVGMSFLLVVLFTYLTNSFINKKQEIHRAIKAIGNEFELMASKAIRENKLIYLSLKNNDFYIGWVKEIPIPSQSNYLRIVPAFSGYKDDVEGLKFNNQHILFYALLLEEENKNSLEPFDTDVVLPISEIISISFYDQEINNLLNGLNLAASL